MVGPAHTLVDRVRSALGERADPAAASGMAGYMRDQFPFLGVGAGDRRLAQKPILADASSWTADELLGAAERLFAQPEREFAYVACDLLRRWNDRLSGDDIGAIEALVATKPWWDTVDALAVHVVGAVVRRDRALQESHMDEWVEDENLWLARTGILHQLLWKDDTDADRLFGYCDRRAGDTEFFIRKALGWALRQYARTDPDAVRSYLARAGQRLSGLTIREATKHL